MNYLKECTSLYLYVDARYPESSSSFSWIQLDTCKYFHESLDRSRLLISRVILKDERILGDMIVTEFDPCAFSSQTRPQI